ncbi:TonB-dependent receptor [Permianibacter sp. IMCC34836]|uniref:TonB-dependent receptor plug domain-containing protein n=1 Tax=Permianibacter fluminis TaxID=2738515 RepID=UPI0015516D18|nr:TonB-dependent receptor [Permianibacter fluminis]NQD36459.1 TonB-dependent receptor [Permianibacter fluminis]
MKRPAFHHRNTLLTAAVLSALSLSAVAAETTSDDSEERVVTIGTRLSGRTTTETAAPVDIISSESIRNAGITDTGELLRALAPSFNMNNTSTSDGQDLMRPASLRSMGPDQVLVLVNGKRRHQQAVVAVQQNVGRGNAGTDMNAIPVTAIDRVEVLRDGAAAQYGSDAIAGVINIILKDDTGTRAWAQLGRTKEGENNKQAGINTGFAAGEGVINVSLEWQDKDEINRAGLSNWGGDSPVTKQLLLVGEAPVEAKQFWFNSELPVGDGQFYAFGGVGKREAESLGFFRAPGSARVWDQIYPIGVTPKLGTQSEDTAWTLGYRTDIADGWDMDVSYGNGENRMEFRNLESLNASYGPDSPTTAYDGALINGMSVINVDFSGTVAWGVGKDDLSVAFGVERREDTYEIEAGDLVSYSRGDTECNQIANPTGDPDAVCAPGFFTTPGMQGFQGYRPEFEGENSRDSTSVYLDTEAFLTDSFSIGAALRFEDYSDFGNTTTGKLSGRFQLTPEFALRGTYSTGFRAPGMQQQFFTQRSISLGSSGVLEDLVTLRPGSELASELGFEDLKEETSESFSFGFVYSGDIWTTTVDIYQINIDDRIVYSQAISDGLNAEVSAFFDAHGAVLDGGDGQLDGVSKVEIFTNAANTETKGLDWVNQWRFEGGADSRWLFEASVHMNDTDITDVNTSSSIVPNSNIVDPGIENLIEDAQPGKRATLSANWMTGPFSTTFRASYYGSYSDHAAAYGLPKHTFGAKTLFDLTGFYDLNDSVRLSAGILNLTDEYPDKWGSDGSPFSDYLGFTYGWNTIPFSLAGRQYYLRGEVTF